MRSFHHERGVGNVVVPGLCHAGSICGVFQVYLIWNSIAILDMHVPLHACNSSDHTVKQVFMINDSIALISVRRAKGITSCGGTVTDDDHLSAGRVDKDRH